jgi:DNA-nicking Smr family endonuclease
MKKNKWPINESDINFWKEVSSDLKIHDRERVRIKGNIDSDQKEIIIKSQINPDNSLNNDSIQSKDLFLQNIATTNYKKFRRIKKNTSKIEAILDLHGYKLGSAQQILENFIISSWQKRIRITLVITGKGKERNSIRYSLLEWLNYRAIRPYVSQISGASNKHGGGGAFYVLLKRNP